MTELGNYIHLPLVPRACGLIFWVLIILVLVDLPYDFAFGYVRGWLLLQFCLLVLS